MPKVEYAKHQPPPPMRMCRRCLHPDDLRSSLVYVVPGSCFACRRTTSAEDSTAVDKAVAGEARLAHSAEMQHRVLKETD